MKLYHNEPGIVLACPECDRAGQLNLRERGSRNTKGDGEVRCYGCKSTFSRDAVVERPARGGPTKGQARGPDAAISLENMGPDEVPEDGDGV